MTDIDSSEGRLSRKRSTSTVDSIANWVRDAIREGRFKPGERLVQEDLAVELGVSRNPFREALRRLAAEGVVELKFNSGATVRVFTRDEVQAYEEAREAIESAAAGAAAERFAASGKQAELDFLMAAMADAADERARRTFLTLNDRFHALVLAVAGNPVLKSFADQLHTPLIEHQLESFANDDWMAVAHAEHLLIADALRRGSRSDAERAMRDHVGRVRRLSNDVPDAFFSQTRRPGSPEGS